MRVGGDQPDNFFLVPSYNYSVSLVQEAIRHCTDAQGIAGILARQRVKSVPRQKD